MLSQNNTRQFKVKLFGQYVIISMLQVLNNFNKNVFQCQLFCVGIYTNPTLRFFSSTVTHTSTGDIFSNSLIEY